MFISRLNDWLERVDPYYTQRIILRKGLYLATWLTFANWIARPDIFPAYAMPIVLLTAVYESPSLDTYKQKEHVLVLLFILSGLVCMSFYLLYPFKFYLLFFALGYYFVLYWLSDKHLPKFKPFILQTIFVGTLNIMVSPPSSLQIALDMFFCVMLGLMVVFIALKLHPNLYGEVWYRGFKLYFNKVENDISAAINKTNKINYTQSIQHLNIIRAYRRLIPKKILRPSMRVVINTRNISFILTHIYLINKDEGFWFNFKQQMQRLADAIEKKQTCIPIEFEFSLDKNENYAQKNLASAIGNWNKLCNKL